MVFRTMIGLVLVTVSSADATTAWAQTRQSRDTGLAARSKRTASIAGRIIHAQGAAAEGARVVVYAVREGAPAGVAATATSGYDGRYEVTGLPAGQFAVGVTPQRTRGFGGDSRRLTSPAVETFYPGTSDRLKAQPITVIDGISTEGIDLWLEPSARRYSIAGRVYWPESIAVENLVVEYGGSEDAQRGLWYVSDPGGLFTLTGASRGSYVLLARADTPDGPLMGIAATDVANDSVYDVRLTLRRPGNIEGRIIIEGSGGPNPETLRVVPTQTLLQVSPLYPAAEATPDGSGRFSLPQLLGEFSISVTGLPSGWRLRRITRAGAVARDNRVAVRPEERVTIEVVIAK
jgi:hypothetical protein